MDIKKNKTTKIKISKGYRLKPSTHKLIRYFQHLMNISQDTVISKALKMLSKEIKIKK
jgi:retron-type reverse transcriptase